MFVCALFQIEGREQPARFDSQNNSKKRFSCPLCVLGMKLRSLDLVLGPSGIEDTGSQTWGMHL